MKYIKAFNIWNIPDELIKYIQPGQWVYAGNINNHKNKREYINKLRDYAKAK